MHSVYEYCPVFQDKQYLLRLVTTEDSEDLLKVYSDEKALPIFNSDNCTNDFHYTTLEEMTQAVEFWLREYNARYYVRWAVIDKMACTAVGTVELFHRDAQDYFTNCGLLRLDLRSDYENVQTIEAILRLIIGDTYEMFSCDKIATKAVPQAAERIKALTGAGFMLSSEVITGADGKTFGDYYVLKK